MPRSQCNMFIQQALGAVDYLEISRNFDTVIVRNIPKMTLRHKSEAKRFTVMIDAFYDNKVSKGITDHSMVPKDLIHMGFNARKPVYGGLGPSKAQPGLLSY